MKAWQELFLFSLLNQSEGRTTLSRLLQQAVSPEGYNRGSKTKRNISDTKKKSRVENNLNLKARRTPKVKCCTSSRWGAVIRSGERQGKSLTLWTSLFSLVSFPMCFSVPSANTQTLSPYLPYSLCCVSCWGQNTVSGEIAPKWNFRAVTHSAGLSVYCPVLCGVSNTLATGVATSLAARQHVESDGGLCLCERPLWLAV